MLSTQTVVVFLLFIIIIRMRACVWVNANIYFAVLQICKYIYLQVKWQRTQHTFHSVCKAKKKTNKQTKYDEWVCALVTLHIYNKYKSTYTFYINDKCLLEADQFANLKAARKKKTHTHTQNKTNHEQNVCECVCAQTVQKVRTSQLGAPNKNADRDCAESAQMLKSFGRNRVLENFYSVYVFHTYNMNGSSVCVCSAKCQGHSWRQVVQNVGRCVYSYITLYYIYIYNIHRQPHLQTPYKSSETFYWS